MNAMTRYARIEALTFDLDDTFWSNGPVMARLEQAHYDWLNGHLGHAERFPLSEYQRRRLEMAQRHPVRRGDFTWLRREALLTMLLDFGLEHPDAVRWTDDTIDVMLRMRHEVEVYAEVPGMLETFRREGYRLAVITNGNVDIRRLGLDEHFDVIIAAGEVGAPKPDPHCFQEALSRMDVRAPSRAMHVGDSWVEDALPAHRLGMSVAWIDVKQERHECPDGVHRLEHVRELPALLERLNGEH